jgi:hypothetical protein
MKRFLSSELRVWHLLVAVVLVGVLSGGVVIARGIPGPMEHRQPQVASFQPASFFGAGDFRMAAASKNDGVNIGPTDGEVEVARVSFTVASGHRQDVAAFFNAEAYKYTGGGYCYLRFELDTIGSTPINPGDLWVADGYVYVDAYPTISAQGFKTNVGPGHHTLYATIYATGGQCYVGDRSLIVIGNRR